MITYRQFIERFEVPSKNLKDLVKKASKRVDVDFDGDVDNNDTAYGGDYGAYVPSADGKKKLKAGPVKFAKEELVSEEDSELDMKRKEEMKARQKANAERQKEFKNKSNELNQDAREKEMDRKYVTPDDIENAMDDAQRQDKSWLEILKRMKG